MEDVKRILVVRRDTQYERKAVHYWIFAILKREEITKMMDS
jgi:hypothetical protein